MNSNYFCAFSDPLTLNAWGRAAGGRDISSTLPVFQDYLGSEQCIFDFNKAFYMYKILRYPIVVKDKVQ